VLPVNPQPSTLTLNPKPFCRDEKTHIGAVGAVGAFTIGGGGAGAGMGGSRGPSGVAGGGLGARSGSEQLLSRPVLVETEGSGARGSSLSLPNGLDASSIPLAGVGMPGCPAAGSTASGPDEGGGAPLGTHAHGPASALNGSTLSGAGGQGGADGGPPAEKTHIGAVGAVGAITMQLSHQPAAAGGGGGGAAGAGSGGLPRWGSSSNLGSSNLTGEAQAADASWYA